MDDQYIDGFAKRLYELRLLTGQSARDMSLSLGQSHNYINGLELKRNYPSMKTFFYICEYLGVTPEEFFSYENSNPKSDNALIDEITKLDARSKEYLLQFLQHMNNQNR